MRAFFPRSTALLAHTTRPGETPETMSPFMMENPLAEPVLRLLEGLKQGPQFIRASAHKAEQQASGSEREEK